MSFGAKTPGRVRPSVRGLQSNPTLQAFPASLPSFSPSAPLLPAVLLRSPKPSPASGNPPLLPAILPRSMPSSPAPRSPIFVSLGALNSHRQEEAWSGADGARPPHHEVPVWKGPGTWSREGTSTPGLVSFLGGATARCVPHLKCGEESLSEAKRRVLSDSAQGLGLSFPG